MLDLPKVASGLLLGCALVLLSACGPGGQTEQDKTDRAEAQQVQPFSPPPAFTLQLPASWQGKVSVATREGEAAAAMVPYASKIVEYLYQPQDAEHVAQPLMIIVAMTKAHWKLTQNMPGPALGKVLGQRDGYVFILCLAQVSPYAEDSEDERKFTDLMVKEAEIVSAFKLP